jgi:hypothetical protein
MRKFILFALLLLSLGAEAQQTAKKYHDRLQARYTFENRMKDNIGFTLRSAKGALKSTRKQTKESKQRERRNARRDRVYTRINKLKTK